MSAPRNDQKAEAMAAIYALGLSLAQTAAVFGVTRQSVYKMLSRRGASLRKSAPREFVIWRGEKYTLRSNGYFAKTTGDRAYLHREVWADENGPIPPGYDVHHVDENKTNSDPSNLAIHTASDHGRRHGFGGNQYTGSLGGRPVKW